MIKDVRDYVNRQSLIDKDEVIFNAVPDTWEGKMKEVKDNTKSFFTWFISNHITKCVDNTASYIPV